MRRGWFNNSSLSFINYPSPAPVLYSLFFSLKNHPQHKVCRWVFFFIQQTTNINIEKSKERNGDVVVFILWSYSTTKKKQQNKDDNFFNINFFFCHPMQKLNMFSFYVGVKYNMDHNFFIIIIIIIIIIIPFNDSLIKILMN